MSGEHVSMHWRLRKQRLAMIGEVCSDCDAKLFPPRDVCPKCGNGPTRQRIVFTKLPLEVVQKSGS